jgi:hypothetical protein
MSTHADSNERPAVGAGTAADGPSPTCSSPNTRTQLQAEIDDVRSEKTSEMPIGAIDENISRTESPFGCVMGLTALAAMGGCLPRFVMLFAPSGNLGHRQARTGSAVSTRWIARTGATPHWIQKNRPFSTKNKLHL